MTNEEAISILRSNKPSHGYTMLQEAIDHAIAQMTEPTDEEVQRAIEYYGKQLYFQKANEEETRKHYGGQLPSWHSEMTEMDNLAITALRQLKQEPCEWCDGEQKYNQIDEKCSWNIWHYKLSRRYTLHIWEDLSSTYRKGIEMDIKYCPACGRYLGESKQ